MVHCTPKHLLLNKKANKQSANDWTVVNNKNKKVVNAKAVAKNKPTKVPTKQHPSHSLLDVNGFTPGKYQSFRQRCIRDRADKGPGQSPQMNSLFCFWSYYLRTHFSNRMYEEFKHYAVEDAQLGFTYGIQCLFRFFSFGLENQFKEDVFSDFQQLVLNDLARNSLYGLEKLWGFLTFRKEKTPLQLRPELSNLLTNHFSTLEHFKAAESQFGFSPCTLINPVASN